MIKWRSRAISFLLWICLFYRNFELCACGSEKGFAHLAFKEKDMYDPFGSLSNWRDCRNANRFLRFGLKCADGRDMTLKIGDFTMRHLLGERRTNNRDAASASPSTSPSTSTSPSASPSTSPSPSPSPVNPLIPVRSVNSPSYPAKPSLKKGNSASQPQPSSRVASRKHIHAIIYASAAVAFCCLITLFALVTCHQAKKAVSVTPWKTDWSGQLQKTFVTGVPLLSRSELEIASEGFSNIIGNVSNCSLYKGTLSNGVEIAVTSTMIGSSIDWSDQHEDHFRKKISMLSAINHKNFMKLLGYCKEEEPFTRMMAFEYTPNGTLFEHLHIKEAEHLDWFARLRIAMGIVYCLEHMEQLNPPLNHRFLNSSSIYLTEDYAAKISDLEFWNEEEKGISVSGSLEQECIVYKFGIILLEIISGRRPFSEDDGLLVLWASSYLKGRRPLKDMVDPTLKSVPEEHISALIEVIRSCINKDPQKRPKIAEVAEQMRLITGISQDGASPRLSPLAWAELEIISS